MEMEQEFEKQIHHGRNVARVRRAKGWKQDVLAGVLNTTQQNISRIEKKPRIEDELLTTIALALEVPVTVLQCMEDDQASYIFENNTFDIDNGGVITENFNNYNPIDKVMELQAENKELYERLLQAEKDKSEWMEKLIDKMKD